MDHLPDIRRARYRRAAGVVTDRLLIVLTLVALPFLFVDWLTGIGKALTDPKLLDVDSEIYQ
jgi:hypothetical protein